MRQVGGWADVLPVYPPSTFVALVPLGLLRFPAAVLVWSLLNSCLFIAAVLLVLSLCPPSHRWLATAFACSFLLIGMALVKDGQPSAFAISSLVIGGALFLGRRHLLLAACLLMFSLAIKPQIGGLIALYFFANKASRRYAGLAIAGAAALLLIGGLTLEMRPASRNWLSELRTNIATSLAPGQVNDPASPSSDEINLQAVTSVLFAHEAASSMVAYGIFLLLAGA